MKTINELLILLLNYIKETATENKDDMLHSGLCIYSDDLYLNNIISRIEADILAVYIKNNLPERKYSWCGFVNSYCWPAFKLKPRVKWLEKHIKLTS